MEADMTGLEGGVSTLASATAVVWKLSAKRVVLELWFGHERGVVGSTSRKVFIILFRLRLTCRVLTALFASNSL